MKLSLKIPLLVVVSVLAGFAITFYFTQAVSRDLIEATKKDQLNSYAKSFNTQVELTANEATARAQLIANITSIKKAFRSGVRAIEGASGGDQMEKAAAKVHWDYLFAELDKAYEIQKAQYGAVQAQFHRKPARSFYRLHMKSKWNDDLSGFRNTVLMVNEDGKVQQGPEVGRGGLGIRGVVPVVDDEGQIGSFEFGLEFDPILEMMKESTGAEYSVFLDTSISQKVTWDEWQEAGEKIGAYKHVFSTESALVSSLIGEEELVSAEDNDEVKSVEFSGTDYGVKLFPLLDFSGKRIGVVVIAKDFSEYSAMRSHSLTLTAIISVIGLLIMVVLLIVVLRVSFLKPVAELSRAADKISTGEVEEKINISSKDELGELGQSFERMRISLIKTIEALEEE